MERAATPEETARSARCSARRSTPARFGFSSTLLNQHMGYQGRPLACRNASREELKAYCNVLKERGKGAIEIALTQPDRRAGRAGARAARLPARRERPAGHLHRPVRPRRHSGGACATSLRKRAPLIARGARPQTSPLPLTREINMRNPFSFAAFPSWKRVFADKSKEAQKAVYGDPAFRNQFREDLKQPASLRQLGAHHASTKCILPALKQLEGRTVAEIAAERRVRTASTRSSTSRWPTTCENEFTMPSFNTRVDRMTESC